MWLINQLRTKCRSNLLLILMLILLIFILGVVFSTELKVLKSPNSIEASVSATLLTTGDYSTFQASPTQLNQLIYDPNFFKNDIDLYRYTTDGLPPSGTVAVKLTWPDDYSNKEVLCLEGVRASNFTIFNKDGSLLYQYHVAPLTKFYTSSLSELYIEPTDSEVYMLLAYEKGVTSLGFIQHPKLFKDGYSLMDLSLKYQNRNAIALSLLILATMLLIVSIFLPNAASKKIINAVAFFLICFNIWILTDLARDNFLIQRTAPFIPPALLLVVFSLSKNFMVPTFVYMNGFLLEKPQTKKINHWLLRLTLVTAVSETVPEFIRLFYWNDFLLTFKMYTFTVVDLLISLGSLSLFILSLYDAYKGSRRSIVLCVGLSICLSTFIISQTTGLLISHWGIIFLLTSIVFIMTDKFNDTQRENAVYTRAILRKNHETERLNQELDHTQTELMLRMGSLVDLRCHETSVHVHRVSEYVRLIGKKIGLPDRDVERIAKASTLHDIGKVGTPDAILNSAAKLSAEEFDVMKRHATMGFEILNGSFIEMLDIAAIIAQTHHEKYNGLGYPEGLSGDEIPLEGRIVAAADVLDALLSTRVYKEPWSLEQAITYFEAEKGKHFDPKIAQVVIDSQRDIQNIINNLPYQETVFPSSDKTSSINFRLK